MKENDNQSSNESLLNLLDLVSETQRMGLRGFIEALRNLHQNQSQLKADRILIYGSYAHGRGHPWSDLDLAVVSEDFWGVPWMDRTAMLEHYVPKNGCLIHPLGVTQQEILRNDFPSPLRNIRNTGVEIYKF
jgi:predicted nucleotidyltransferase